MFDEFCESLDKPLGRSVSAESLILVKELGIDVAIINYGLYIKKVKFINPFVFMLY